MNDPAPSTLQRNAAAAPLRFLTGQQPFVVAAAVLLISLWITAGALSQSILIGRLSFPMTHNDVNYLIEGMRHLLYIELNGFWAELSRLYTDLMHAPLSDYQAALGFYVFGFHDWAPYATNILYVFVFLGVCAWLLRGIPNVVVIAGLLAVAGMPLLFSTVSEFAPEIPLGLFTAIGVLLTLRIHALDRALDARALAGLCFALGLLGKTSSLVFVPLVACATLGLVFVRDVLLARQLHWRSLTRAVSNGVLHLVLSLWLPALYIIPWWRHFVDYFYLAMFDAANVKAYGGGSLSGTKNLLFYLTDQGGQYTFGNLLWAYVGTIALGVAAASRRGDRPYISQQMQLLLMVVFMWLAPTAATAKNTLFGAPFSFLLAFMIVMALRSIYETLGRLTGIAAVSLLSFLLLVSATSRYFLPNTPGFYWDNPDAHIVRETWVAAMDRFKTVILGNAPRYHTGSVYMTAPSYFLMPVMWYDFLKTDPSLQWTFLSLWADPDPQHHLDFIHQYKEDFVIAGQRDNGLTYALPLIPGAVASEDAVLAALWKDPEYMPIDQFYGPGGRAITVFQRRTAYGGWHLLHGLHRDGSGKLVSAGTLIYVQAYAPNALPAELAIDATGPAGQKIDVVINRERVGQLAFDANGKSSVSEAFNLVPGQNDIVLRKSSDAPVEFDRLLVIRKISPDD